MKAQFMAAAAVLATGALAGHNGRRHAHEDFHLIGRKLAGSGYSAGTAPASESTCGCTTIYTTITGAPTLVIPPPEKTTTSTSVIQLTETTTVAPVPTSTVVVVPTPYATTCPTTGVYTIPATTITLTSETTVCGATSTPITSGTYSAGGVTTIVETSTTVVCPYATTTSTGGSVVSTILTTTYVCPSAGTYTVVPPLTTTCSESTVWVYPTPTSYPSGTYTQPEVVTTVTETDYVVYCPFATISPSTTIPAPVYTTSAAPVYTSSAVPVYSSAAVSTPVYSAPESTPTGSLGVSGNQWAITYTPYDSTGNCKDASTVSSDISAIAAAGFQVVRLYSTDCSGLTNIGSACAASGLKVILGVFIEASGISVAQQQVTEIIAWGQWSMVELIVVGNEAVSSGYCSASELASFVASSAAAFAGAGYTGPCTTTEPLDIWQANADVLCGVVDIVGCNIHPFFNADVSAADAGPFVSSQLDIVDTLCPGKTGVNLETGWPSGGSCNGVACPGVAEQSIAVASITASCGGRSVMFSYQNDPWKAPGAFDCEQSWGLIQLF